jgi:arylsulfatase A-like enzyme
MALSLSQAAAGKLKNLLVCFSVGNLCFLRRWYDLEHLKERSMDYYRTGPSDAALLLATLICAFLLTGVLWLAWLWVERSPTPGRLKFAQCAFLLLLLYPLESVRRYWNEDTRPDVVTNTALLAVEAILAAGVILALFGNVRIVRAARRMALLLTLLFPSLMIDFGWSRLGAESASVYLPKPPAPMLPPHPGTPRRLVWLLFDEFDQRLAFDMRQPSVDLPELDRLRGESLVSNRVRQTASWTTLAVPSLLSGQIFARVELIDANTLRVYPEGARGGLNWDDLPNVFKHAREMGFNSALVGWHHPYCRVLGESLVSCLDAPSGDATPALVRETSAAEEGVWKTVPFLFRLQLANCFDMFRMDGVSTSEKLRDEYVQQRQQQQYFRIRDRAYAEIADRQIDLLFIHFPTPHPFAIYDRQRRDFTLSSTTSYFDNLALVDRTVGEVRRALEQAGLWDQTSLLITSDHGLRPQLWRGRYNWSKELDRLTAGGMSETVPFIVKLAHQDHAVVYDKAFSNVVSGDLALAILSGQVSTAVEAATWLDEHAAVAGKSVR